MSTSNWFSSQWHLTQNLSLYRKPWCLKCNFLLNRLLWFCSWWGRWTRFMKVWTFRAGCFRLSSSLCASLFLPTVFLIVKSWNAVFGLTSLDFVLVYIWFEYISLLEGLQLFFKRTPVYVQVLTRLFHTSYPRLLFSCGCRIGLSLFTGGLGWG